MKKISTLILVLLFLSLTGCKDNTKISENYPTLSSAKNYVCVYDGALPKGTRFQEGQSANRDYLFLDNGKIFRCTDYIYDYENMSGTLELVSLDSEGTFNSIEWPFGQINPDNLGLVPHKDSFFTQQWEKDDKSDCYKAVITVYDSKFNVKNIVSLDFLEGNDERFYYDFALDKEGYIHINYRDFKSGSLKSKYMLVSPDGELIFKEDVGSIDFYQFMTLYDGSLALEYLEELPDKHVKHYLMQFDKNTGEKKTLREYIEYIPFNYYDKNTYICGEYCQGVFLCDIVSGETKSIFSWDENDIPRRFVENIQAFEDKTVTLTYYDDNDNTGFMVLKPMDNDDISEVEFAVSPSGKIHYAYAVSEFNKKHPNVRITMNDSYDQNLLLAKLSTGDGPALVEANYVGFENHAKLWDVIEFSDDSVIDYLNYTVLRIGSIDGNLYGVMQDFSIETMATYLDDTQLEYNAFINRADNTQEIKAMISKADNLNLATYYFDHGIEDNFYFDKEGNFKLEPESFEAFLKVIDELGCSSNVLLCEEPLLSGEVLGETIYIKRPEDLIFYENYYGKDVNFSGYPGTSGPVSFIFDPFILAVPSKAPSEDKEIAMEFLNMLLSYDYQMDVKDNSNFNLSVRTDVLKQQIYSVTADTFSDRAENDYKPLPYEPDNAENEKNLFNLIGDSKAYPYYRYEDYTAILREEFMEYFDGKIKEEMLLDRIKNRVSLYVKEMN